MNDFLIIISLIASFALMFFSGYNYAACKALKILRHINNQTEQFKLDTLLEVDKMKRIVEEHIEDTEEAKKFYYSQEH